jgi:hypothetical protein
MSNTPCRAAEIGVELAQVLRLKDKVRREAASGALDDDNAVAAEDLFETLEGRWAALQSLAGQVQAQSGKGGLVQTLIALVEALQLDDVLSASSLNPFYKRRFGLAQRRLIRLLYSACYSVPEGELDDDLRMLREHYAPRGFHSVEHIDQLDAPHAAA